MKMDTNGGIASAEEQMADRHYADAFKTETKPVFAVSMEFSTKQREMSNFHISKVS